MKRTPLRRGKPLERGSTPLRPGPPLARQTPVKKVCRKRGGARFPHRRDPEYCRWIRTLGCVAGGSAAAAARLADRFRAKGEEPPVSTEVWLILFGVKDCSGPIECAHVVSRGAGGDDRSNTVSLCRTHHRQQHDRGIKSFQAIYALDLAAIAAELGQRYELREEAPW